MVDSIADTTRLSLIELGSHGLCQSVTWLEHYESQRTIFRAASRRIPMSRAGQGVPCASPSVHLRIGALVTDVFGALVLAPARVMAWVPSWITPAESVEIA